ncbi:MAG: FkbM family methyltransferase [Brumimicrobium sp.]
MINYIKRKLSKKNVKNTFKEYGYEIKKFDIEHIGKVDYAQWLHPFEKPKVLTFDNVQFYKNLCDEGDMIVDIGAHSGDTTVPMALAVGKDGLVLGIEPNKYVFKILAKNAELNKDKTNIIASCFAATEKDGFFSFNYSDASFCNGGFLSQIENSQHKHNYELEVEGKNLQDYLDNNHKENLNKLTLVKIDAEGYDKEILKTIPDILEKYKPALMVECYKKLNNQERDELFDVLDGYKYDLFYLEDFENKVELRQIHKSNMNDEKHFEILGLHRSKKEQYTFKYK